MHKLVEEQTRIRTSVRAVLSSDMKMTRERSDARHGFTVKRSALSAGIMIPKYYDPALALAVSEAEAQAEAPWLSIQELIDAGLLSVSTGNEVGKMAYGTGLVPFIRTSDIAELEVKADPRQGISDEIYKKFSIKASLKEGDVLLVRDGTYLVGSSALVAADDTPSIICGGLYRLRSLDHQVLPPAMLLACLNIPVVRWQMRARQFTRDVIDTIGHRLLEVKIPNPASPFAKRLGAGLTSEMEAKTIVRNSIATVLSAIEPNIPARARGRPGWSMRG